MNSISIRKRIFIILFASMALVMSLMFALVYIVAGAVMEKTLSEYLISAVDANTDKIIFLEKDVAEIIKESDNDDLFVDYGSGVLQIDDDFLDMLSDVESALYTQDGKLLYGNNSLSRNMPLEAFDASRLYRQVISGKRYIVYDRKITGEKLDGLWIRGVVPLTKKQDQLEQITRSVAAFIPVLVVMVVLVSFLASSSILMPIRRMKEIAAAIVGADDLGKRIETGSNRDELYQLAVTFNEMLGRLEDSFNREKQFTSDASHELRTPVAVIRAQIEHIQAKEPTENEYIEAIETIGRQNKRMEKLINDMLGLSRIEQGEKRYPMSETDLSEIVRTTVDDMSRIRFRNIEVVSKVEKEVIIKGNRNLLERAVINLIDNAYKYGRENGRTVVSLRKEGGNAHLEVSDNGCGISEDALGKIFDRFYREEKSRSEVEGYGLGLSLVHEIVSLHGGAVKVTSQKGTGSRFEVEIPLLLR